MDTALEAPAQAPAEAPRPSRGSPLLAALVVVLAAAGAVAARIPHLHRPASLDEAGYLVVGAGWRPGTSLYGDYWVDRPPLLIGLYRWAALHGEVSGVRLLGCVAAALAVVLTAAAAHRVGGPRAAGWAALVAGSLLASRHVDAQVVDGELLSAPFVAAGMYAVVVAASARRRAPALLAAAGAGLALVAAVAVKQNMVDAGLFGAVVLLLSVLRREMTLRRATALAGGALAGALVGAGAVALWAVSRGTSLSGLWYALYPFRVAARRILGEHTGVHTLARKRAMLDDVVWSGLLLAPLAGLVGLVRTRLDPVVGGLLVVLVYDVFSISAGDSAWLHYLVQAVVPASLLLGVLAGRVLGVRLAGVLILVSAAWTALSPHHLPVHDPRRSDRIGAEVGRSAEPGDTMVTLYSRPGINLSAGMSSPYPYLWSLPMKVRDPRLRLLGATLDGTAGRPAPTWVVVYAGEGFFGVRYPDVLDALHAHYRLDGTAHRAHVYLRDGLRRPPLRR